MSAIVLNVDADEPRDSQPRPAGSAVTSGPQGSSRGEPDDPGPTALERRNVRYYLSGLALIGAAGSTTVILAPIIGVVTLGAATSQVGVLTLIYLVLSVGLQVPFASWADRRRDHLRILPLTCLISALVAAIVPLLYLVGRLTIGSLYLAVALYTLVGVFRGSLGHAIVNQLAPPHRRGAVVGRLNGLSGGVDTASQSLSSGLVSLIPAPIAMFAASAAMLLAPGMLTRVRLPATAGAPPPTSREAGHETSRFIVYRLAKMPALWVVVAYGFANSLVEPVFIPFVLRQLVVPPGLVGLLLAAGALGGIVGGWLASRVITRLGLRACLAVATATSSVGIFILLLAVPGPMATVCIIGFELLTSFGGTIVVAAVFGQLQQECGIDTVARTLASASTALQVAGIAGVAAGIAISLVLPARANVAFYLVGALLVTCYLVAGRLASWHTD